MNKLISTIKCISTSHAEVCNLQFSGCILIIQQNNQNLIQIC